MIFYGNNDWRDYVAHGFESWSMHKYLKKIGDGPNAKYIYPEDVKKEWGKHANRWTYLTDTKTRVNPLPSSSIRKHITKGAGSNNIAKKETATKDRTYSYVDAVRDRDEKENRKTAYKRWSNSEYRWNNYIYGKDDMAKGKIQSAKRRRLSNQINRKVTKKYDRR